MPSLPAYGAEPVDVGALGKRANHGISIFYDICDCQKQLLSRKKGTEPKSVAMLVILTVRNDINGEEVFPKASTWAEARQKGRYFRDLRGLVGV
jgi:hypothetical protein